MIQALCARRITAALIALFILLTGAGAEAQDFLNLSAPGARALGMGGAFIGVADDATTAVSNPAGLSNLSRPEVYVEFKTKQDTFGETGERSGFLSFLSGAYPLSPSITVAALVNNFGHIEGDQDSLTIAGAVGARINSGFRVGIALGIDRVVFKFDDDDEFSDTATKAILGAQFDLRSNVTVGLSTALSSDAGTVGSPNRVGLGLAFTPSPQLVLALDAVHLRELDDEFTQNITEVHLGAEYLLFSNNTDRLFVRGGYCECPDIYDFSEFGEDIFPFGSSHSGTVGVGYASGQRFQTDFGFASKAREVTISAAFRF